MINIRLLIIFVYSFMFVFSSLINQSLIAQAFYFGRNKIQYTEFDWQIMETDHFDIYYYPEMEDIAEKGAFYAEESFSFLETKFNHTVTRRIPLIFYSTHQHFQQTNVTPGFIPEGVGGFFEFMKGRVVIPNTGNLFDFRHVIRHELVHVFMHSKINNIFMQHGKFEGTYTPLWFTEGLAEFWSSDWDAQGEMVLKDAVLNNYVVGLENVYQILGTFTMYKMGQDILEFIAWNYGEDKVLLLLENLWKHERFEECFREAIGKDYREFDDEYLYDLKKRYYPLLAENDFNSQVTETIVRDGYNFKPTFYRENDEDYVLFVGNRTGYSCVFMKPVEPSGLREKENVEVLIKGERTSDFEAFHIFQSKIDITTDGKLVFTSKSGETDALYIYDVPERKIENKIYFKNLVAMYSPAWSPDGKEIVFSGLNISGYRDLYIYQLESESLLKLTNDFYDDNDPVWSPDGKYIAFSSDRSSHGSSGALNIFIINRENFGIHYLTFGEHGDETPEFSPDGKYLAYTSDQDGTKNIYLIENPLQNIDAQTPLSSKKMTNYIGTTFDPEWTDDGKLMFGTFEGGRFQIRLDNNFLESTGQAETIEQTVIVEENLWSFPNITNAKVGSKKPYLRDYDLDIATTQVAQDPIFGTTGGALVAFSDVLGNDRYNLLLYNNARTSSDFWKSFNFAVTKISLGKRINYAYGLYRFSGYFYNPADLYYYEERLGGLLSISYPLSQFSRLEMRHSLSYSDKDWFYTRRQAWLNSSFISYINDNSLWGVSGPIEGRRINITLGNTYDFVFSEVNYLTALIDLRYYQRLSMRSAYAVRILSLLNEGSETRQFYFGGSWDLRGYKRWSLHGERIMLLSQELRFPLIDLIGIRLPKFSLGLNSIRGALFVDAGNAWNDNLDEVLGSFGLGVRLRLGYFLVLRWDFGRRTNFRHISNHTFTQFFFGWDF